MHIDMALAELRSLERKQNLKIDDDSVPFLAHLRTGGLLNDEDWLALQDYMTEAFDFLRREPYKQGDVIDVDGDPRNADWIRLVCTFRLTDHKLPEWATLWLRRLHPDSDTRFWRKVAQFAAELGLPSMTKKPARQTETKMQSEEPSPQWNSVSEPPSVPGFYHLREKGSTAILDGRYGEGGWSVAYGGPTYSPINVGHSRLEWQQKPIIAIPQGMYVRFGEGSKTPWYSASELPSRPGLYELRKKGSQQSALVQYTNGKWSVSFSGATEWRGLIADPRTLKKDYISMTGNLSFCGFR